MREKNKIQGAKRVKGQKEIFLRIQNKITITKNIQTAFPEKWISGF